MVVRWLVAFGRFWVDFLIGDTPELFVGAVVAVGVTFALVAAGSHVAAMIWLPVAVVAILVASVARAIRRG
jgi:hypothetical protein